MLESLEQTFGSKENRAGALNGWWDFFIVVKDTQRK